MCVLTILVEFLHVALFVCDELMENTSHLLHGGRRGVVLVVEKDLEENRNEMETFDVRHAGGVVFEHGEEEFEGVEGERVGVEKKLLESVNTNRGRDVIAF